METINVDGRELPMPAWKEGVMYPPIADGAWCGDNEWHPMYDDDDDTWSQTSYYLEYDDDDGWRVMENDGDGNVDFCCPLDEWDETYEAYLGKWDEYYAWVAERGEDPLGVFFVMPVTKVAQEWRIIVQRIIGGIRLRLDPPRQNGQFYPVVMPSHLREWLGCEFSDGAIFARGACPDDMPLEDRAGWAENSFRKASAENEGYNRTDREMITMHAQQDGSYILLELVYDDADAAEKIKRAALCAINRSN